MIAPDRIHLFEEHSSTLPIWWAQRGAAATVVYLDAHLDLQRVGEEEIAALGRCKSIEEVKALEAPDHYQVQVAAEVQLLAAKLSQAQHNEGRL